MDLGQMYIFDDQALIVRSSNYILFFKQEYDEFIEKKRWKKYHQINMRGFIYYIKGNTQISITTDEKIYLYLMDK